MLNLPFHFESEARIRASSDALFSYLDDPRRLSSHMSKSSWMMFGSRMDIQVDEAEAHAVGSRIRLSGHVLGIRTHVDETVIERTPPFRKTWETIGMPRLLVIGAYRMGFEIRPESNYSLLRVLIDFAIPERRPARWLGYTFGRWYARWCTSRMVNDAAKHFESGAKWPSAS